ncbi:hypothetical protein B4U79_04639 [Dinothrombium tinctorium]|uniref:Uncharacterized protein n=1 Tax=Dinothrombium tinctorium TaxID=1965070 RepID=A0A443QPU3_9ACAR|nr:hypothetical protein B4U79_04639 [Dinothrombium tinctorium]
MSEWWRKLKHSSSGSKASGESDASRDEEFVVLSPETDKRAVLDSFKTHWLQAYTIMLRKTIPPSQCSDFTNESMITTDDVTSIINHIDQMTTLLIQENVALNSSTPIMMSPLLDSLIDYLLMEAILDKIFNWSLNAGEFTNVMKLEQLKLYELLISQLCHQTALFQKPLVRPLLQLLVSQM